MAKSVGLDPGEFEIKVVELDGSYRKTRLNKLIFERVADSGDGGALRADILAEAVRHTLKEASIGTDSVTLGYPSREAVLRSIEVPFSGRDAIRKVIKAEVEGAIHSHSVDDMVVDFHPVAEDEDGTRVMVAAVPKSGLRVALNAYERVGLEPEVVDLDTIALYRVAHWCGAFHEEALVRGEAPVEELVDEDHLPAVREVLGAVPVRVVMDLGSRSTRVLLVVGGHLTETRTLRIGDSVVADQIASHYGLPMDVARDAMHECLETGADYEATSDDDELLVLEEDSDEELEPPLPAGSQEPGDEASTLTVHHQVVAQARDRFVQRLEGELVRFLTAVPNLGSVEAVWVTGGASSMVGIGPMIEALFGCAPRDLDVMGRLAHSLDEDDAAAANPHVAVAVGLALGRLGGPAVFNFRQEDLAYTRGFDRIKFPLAIASMIALFLVVVYAVKSLHEIRCLRMEAGETYHGEEARGRAKYQFYGHVGALINPGGGTWFSDDKFFGRKEYQKLYADVEKKPVFERLDLIHDGLNAYLVTKQKDYQIFQDLQVESGLAILVRLAEILDRHKERLGRYLLVKLDVNLPSKGRGRFLAIKVGFRGEDFRTRQGILERALKEACDDKIYPDTPFAEYDERAAQPHLFQDSDESGVLGAYYDFKLRIKDSFDPFPVATGVGASEQEVMR